MPVTQVRSKQQLLVTDNVSFGGLYRITNLVDPTGAQDAATKAYVDAVKQALDIKDSVRAATTANITLSGTQTIDGVALIAGNRVLVKDQTAGQDNGIYVVAAGAWTRSTDADTSADVNPGMFVFVEEGTANGDNGYVLTTNGPITLGTTPLAFTQFSGAGQVDAGAGLTKTGNTINVGTASVNRIVVNANDIDLATVATVTAGTYGNSGFDVPNISVDAYGRFSAVANRNLFGTPAANLVFASPNGATGAPTFRALVAADIPSLDASKITTGALLNARGGTGLDTSAAANGTLLIGNGGGFTLATLTAGTAISITNASGSITINNTGVTSLTGTANQVTVSAATGAITLSLPQNIHTAATPTFARLTLTDGTQTTSTPVLSMTQTWNAGAVVFEGFKINITDTASAAGSLLMDLEVGGTSRFAVRKDGAVTAGSWAGTTIAANVGGTGQTTYAVGDILYADTTSTLAKLGAGATNTVLLSGTAPSWGKVGLTTHVSGTLGIANGGTNTTTAPTNGQLLIGNGGNYSVANLSSGTGITITNGAGTIQIAVNSVDVIVAANYVVRENPTGAVDGTNATFTLAAAPLAGKEMVFVNGVLQNSGTGNDYTISGAIITFLSGAIPQTGDIVRVTYLK